MKRLLVILLALAAPALAAQFSQQELLTEQLAQTADFTVTTDRVYVAGWSVRETAGATAAIIIRNAGDTDSGTGGVQCNASGGVTQVGGRPIAFVRLAANETVGDSYALAVPSPSGVCVDVLSGSVDFQLTVAR